MAKYKRPFVDICNDVMNGINVTMQALAVTLNTDGTQTVKFCDIFYAQKGFNVMIDGKSYVITDFSQVNETLTLQANFTGDPTITNRVIFDLYRPYFFYGTPLTTAAELDQIKPAELKTPMIWLWEKFKETFYRDEMIERTIDDVEFYALSQPPKKLMQMIRIDIERDCVNPMRRLLEMFFAEIERRTDIFSADDLQFSTEEFARFGIVGRNQGATKSVLMENLSGVGGYCTLDLFFKDACACPPIVIPTPANVRTLSNGNTRTLSTGNTRTLS